MKRGMTLLVALLLLASALNLAGCREQPTVTVRSGEIVLCTEGEVLSDTTVEKEVPADEVEQYKVTTRVETCYLHRKLFALYEEAQRSIRDGDLEGARKKLAEIVALDPGYRMAPLQLADAEAGKTPQADTSVRSGGPQGRTPVTPAPGGAAPPATQEPGEEADTPNEAGFLGGLVPYVPDTLPGFNGQQLFVDAFVLTRHYLPTSPDSFRALVIVVEKFQDSASPQKRMETSMRSGYPTGGELFRLEGDPAYFGANGPHAIVSFVQGDLLVTLEGTSVTADGRVLKAQLVSLAEAVSP